MSISRSIASLMKRIHTLLSPQVSASEADELLYYGEGRMGYPAEEFYIIHADAYLSAAVQNLLKERRGQQRKFPVTMTVKTLPQRSNNGIVGYYEFWCLGSLQCRELLQEQVSDDGTTRIVPYSPRLIV